jgi:hypothetical protein
VAVAALGREGRGARGREGREVERQRARHARAVVAVRPQLRCQRLLWLRGSGASFVLQGSGVSLGFGFFRVLQGWCLGFGFRVLQAVRPQLRCQRLSGGGASLSGLRCAPRRLTRRITRLRAVPSGTVLTLRISAQQKCGAVPRRARV